MRRRQREGMPTRAEPMGHARRTRPPAHIRRPRPSRRTRQEWHEARLVLVLALPLTVLLLWQGGPLVTRWVASRWSGPLSVLIGLALLAPSGGLVLWRAWRRWTRRWALAASYDTRQSLRALQALDPLAFERHVGGLFAAEGYRVALTKRSGDEGIDLWLSRPDGTKIPAQCKRYGAEKVGSPDLQRFSGALRQALAVEGYFVTTSSFTPAAERWAAQEGIHLIDGPELLRWQARLAHRIDGTAGAPPASLPEAPPGEGGGASTRTRSWPQPR